HELEMPDRRVLRLLVAGERAAKRVLLPLRDQRRRTGDAGERRGADEADGRLRLDYADRVAGLDGQPRELERFIGGDTARDAEQDPRHGAVLSSRGSGSWPCRS